MARGEHNARHDDRRPFIDPYFAASPSGTTVFAGSVPGYSQPDAIDPTGYSLKDLELPGRIADGMIPDDVLAPLGPVAKVGQAPPMGAVGTPGDSLLVGAVAPSSYGSYNGPTPGGALLDESREYAPSVWLGDPAGDPKSKMAMPPGACSRTEDLGMDPKQFAGQFIGVPHAQAAAPLEYGARRAGIGTAGGLGGPTVYGVTPEHLQSTLERGKEIYGGYAGLLVDPSPLHGSGVYGGLYDTAYDDGYDHPIGRGGYDSAPGRHGGSFGPAALSAVGQPLFREVGPGDEYDVGVDPGENPAWRRPGRTRAAGPYDLAYPEAAPFEGNR